MSDQPERRGFDLGDYVEVKDRIARFYDLFGGGRLVTERVELTREPDDKPKVIVYALAYRTVDDPHPGTGTSWMYLPGSTPYTRSSELENAETSAWGRAIGSLGILIDRSIASANEVRDKTAPTPTDAPADEYPAGEWSTRGKAVTGRAPYDGNLRETPDGGVFGFRVEPPEGKPYAILAEGPLALPVSLVWSSLVGQSVHVTGAAELVPWSKKVDGQVRKMPPYRLIHAKRIESADIIIPAPPDGPLEALDAANEAYHDAVDAELDAIVEALP